MEEAAVLYIPVSPPAGDMGGSGRDCLFFISRTPVEQPVELSSGLAKPDNQLDCLLNIFTVWYRQNLFFSVPVPQNVKFKFFLGFYQRHVLFSEHSALEYILYVYLYILVST